MDLLGAAEFVELREQVSDSLALPRHSSRGETRCGGHWFTVVRNRARPFLTIAPCCVINSSHYQPTVTRAQIPLTLRDRQLPVTAAWFSGDSRAASVRTRHETGPERLALGRS